MIETASDYNDVYLKISAARDDRREDDLIPISFTQNKIKKKDYHKALFTPVDKNAVQCSKDNSKCSKYKGGYEENFKKWLDENNVCKKVRCVCKELSADKTFNSIGDASRETGISTSSIINNAKGRNKSCRKDRYGYYFTYIDD